MVTTPPIPKRLTILTITLSIGRPRHVQARALFVEELAGGDAIGQTMPFACLGESARQSGLRFRRIVAAPGQPVEAACCSKLGGSCALPLRQVPGETKTLPGRVRTGRRTGEQDLAPEPMQLG